jgi:chromate transport protein ChrA
VSWAAGLLSRMALAVVPALIALACVVVASGFLIGALYYCLLALPEPPEVAALIVGLVMLALAVLVLVGARLIARSGQRAGRAVAPDPGTLAAELGTRAAREASMAAEAHPYYTFCAAFLAGLTLGGSPQARSFVETAMRAADRARGR